MIENNATLPIGKQIATELLAIKAIKLQPNTPFTWASGWQSPIYCDNRMTLSFTALRTFIKEEFAKTIKVKFPQTEIVAGVATAGIPQGVLVADALGLPFIYIRDKVKTHGMTNQIEGGIQEGKNVFVIEDLISTGGSAITAIDAIRKANMNVIGLGAIFTYGFEYADINLQQVAVDYFTLVNYDDLLSVASALSLINADDLESLKAWRQDPATWKS